MTTSEGTSVPRLLPVIDDWDTGGFWRAAQGDELVVRICNGCEAVLHVPRAYCSHCGSWDGRWAATSGRGRLISWTTVAHQVHSSFPVPYTVILVHLDDFPAVHFVGYLPGSPNLQDGQAMEVWFENLDDDTRIPQWRQSLT